MACLFSFLSGKTWTLSVLMKSSGNAMQQVDLSIFQKIWLAVGGPEGEVL